MKRLATRSSRWSRVCVFSLATAGFGLAVPAAQQTAPTRQPAVMGVLPGGPVFLPGRPKPPVGNVLDIESLVGVPSDEFRMERRNNFYKKDGSDGLYRWAASGHWSNYDEAKTGNWQASVPDPLEVEQRPDGDGRADQWRTTRRPEIVKLFETWLYGKVPSNAPRVVWTAGEWTQGTNGEIATLTRTATGRFVNADGSAFRATGSLHATAGSSRSRRQPRHLPPRRSGRSRCGSRTRRTCRRTGPRSCPEHDPGHLHDSRQCDRPCAARAGRKRRGRARHGIRHGHFSAERAQHPQSSREAKDDWGAIRRYGWAVSRALDYLETEPRVDARQVALTGHSIGGKQALVAAAFDERIGLVFASCSGEGGASMMRHDWGETIDDLAQLSPQNYAANFQYWVAHWNEMPVDAHMLVALMAPRPAFITGGTEDQWSDPVGVFWTGFHASPASRAPRQEGPGRQDAAGAERLHRWRCSSTTTSADTSRPRGVSEVPRTASRRTLRMRKWTADRLEVDAARRAR